MTTIRKIVTSKIDGNGADSNDINEIRPFGETAFYLDNNNKLALMIFDGARTPQRSKVLSPGVMWGSNADSGDGTGLDTIKLIPDARLHYNFGGYDNHQHLVIDPTAPNHIHIRAGGTIDNSNADLFLGGELTHVKVSDTSDNVVIRTSTVGEGITERNWTFGADGTLTFPDGATSTGSTVFANSSSYKIQTISVDGSPSNVVSTFEFGIGSMTIPGNGVIQNEGQTGYWALDGVNNRLQFPNLARIGYGINEGLTNEEDLRIYADNTGSIFLLAGSEQWTFGNNGGLKFPDATVQTTAYVAADNVAKVSSTWTVTTGTADYSFTVPVNGVYQLWVRSNIPNGIISYIATAAVTNANVGVLGTQYAWNYTGAGDPILLTTLPAQFIGTEGAISTSNPSVGTSTNTFVFGIQNNTAENVIVEYGYTKIS